MVVHPLRGAMMVAELEVIKTYISRCKNKVAEKIATQPILDLSLDADRIPGLQVPTQWWEYEGLVFPGRYATR